MATIAFIMPSLAVGGAEKNTVSLANYFQSKGHRVLIYTVFDNLKLAPELKEGIRIRSLRLNRMRNLMRHIGPLQRSDSIDVLISNLWPLNLWVRLGLMLSRRKSLTLLVEHISLSKGLSVHSKIERLASVIFHRFLIGKSVRMIAVSRGVAEDLIANFRVHPERVSVIHNPVIEDFETRRSASRKQMQNNRAEIKLLAVGSFKPQKDYLTLLRAMNVLRSRGVAFKLKIAGDGFLRNEIEAQVESLNLQQHVTLLGEVLDTQTLYLNSDIYVLSSAWEGFGNTIVEALSFGCKVVSTDCPAGPSEILDGGRWGKLVPVGDPDALASAIVSMNGTEIDRVAQIEYCRRFSSDVVGQQYLEACGLGVREYHKIPKLG